MLLALESIPMNSVYYKLGTILAFIGGRSKFINHLVQSTIFKFKITLYILLT
jgi:hypothetical protein